MRLWLHHLAFLLLALAPAACAAATRVDEGPEAESRRSVSPAHTEADTRFVQGMIPHHRQALEMAALVADRTDSRDISLLAERIETSQTDEIRQMEKWLRDRGEEIPAADAQDHMASGHGMRMPGMLTQAEMESLAEARGAAFDRRFLELMIRHHEGALLMVGQLLSAARSGQEVDVFRLASEIDSSQHIEIERMQRMLQQMG